MVLDIGQKFNDLKVVFFIKQGEYAETYRVKSADGKLRFLKLINRGKLHKSQFTEDGKILEIEIVKMLDNPGLCKFITDGECVMNGQRYAFFVTEFISGETVAQKVTREQQCSVYDAKNIAIHTLEVLQYLHTLPKPIIHNEVTIQNILLDLSSDNQEAIKLIDFGYSNFLNDQTRGYKLDGLNPFYLAPERFNGVSCVQSDLYAVGAMIYHLLFGITPWYIDISRYDDDVQIDAILAERRKPLKMLNAELFEMDEQLINSMAKAMAFDIDDRFQSADEFIKALKGELKVEPQATSRGEAEVKKVKPKNVRRGNGFKDVAGMTELKESITKSVLNILRNTEKAKKYKISIPNGMLLYGPPGCGKSFFAEKFAEESGYNFIYVKSSDLASIYVHGSQEKIGKLFDEARENAPTILCFDEFDALVPNRDDINNASQSGEVNEFLSQLNNCGQDGVFVIASTNRPQNIDKAVLRRGRIDKVIYLPVPDKEARAGIFQIHMADRPYDIGIDYNKLAELTEYYVASDIAYIVNEAARVALEQDCNITQEILEDAIKLTSPSVSKKAIEEYENIKQEIEGSASEKPRGRVGFKT